MRQGCGQWLCPSLPCMSQSRVPHLGNLLVSCQFGGTLNCVLTALHVYRVFSSRNSRYDHIRATFSSSVNMSPQPGVRDIEVSVCHCWAASRYLGPGIHLRSLPGAFCEQAWLHPHARRPDFSPKVCNQAASRWESF